MNAEIGVIGGSGLYAMEALQGVREAAMLTPFGEPSDAFRVGTLGGRSVAFLARHGRGHRRLPSEVNYRANIYGFKMLGVERIFSASAVGSLREDIAPLDLVLPDQIVDRTWRREPTFFGDGIAAHVSLADPFCPQLRAVLMQTSGDAGARVHPRGTYICIEGPQFSSRAESALYRSRGHDVIGMTNATEARLAREAEICYATLALVTDYDCWHEEEAPVTVEQVVKRLTTNAAVARAWIARTISVLPRERSCECGRALEHAVITDPAAIPEDARERLRPILRRTLETS